MLKAIVDDIETVPEVLREHYTKVGEKYVLGTDDKDFKSQLSEFRNNNINLKQQAEQLTAQLEAFKDIDPSKVPDAMAALDKLKDLEEKNLIDAGKLDEVLAQRTERMRADFEGKTSQLTSNLDAASKERDTYKTRLSDVLIDSTISQAVSLVGVPRKGAMTDILARAKQVWHVDEDGALVPMDGKKVMYGKDGNSQLTPEEWSASLIQSASYLFEPNSGGGAPGGSGGGGQQGQVSRDDQSAVNSSIEDIATGKVVVSM